MYTPVFLTISTWNPHRLLFNPVKLAFFNSRSYSVDVSVFPFSSIGCSHLKLFLARNLFSVNFKSLRRKPHDWMSNGNSSNCMSGQFTWALNVCLIMSSFFSVVSPTVSPIFWQKFFDLPRHWGTRIFTTASDSFFTADLVFSKETWFSNTTSGNHKSLKLEEVF